MRVCGTLIHCHPESCSIVQISSKENPLIALGNFPIVENWAGA